MGLRESVCERVKYLRWSVDEKVKACVTKMRNGKGV